MPGDALLFQRLSVSTIGAGRFHGRVRDGIGWVTDAKVTKQYGPRGKRFLIDATFEALIWPDDRPINGNPAGLSLMVGFIKHDQSY